MSRIFVFKKDGLKKDELNQIVRKIVKRLKKEELNASIGGSLGKYKLKTSEIIHQTEKLGLINIKLIKRYLYLFLRSAF